MNEKRKTKISKFLSLILRHQPEEINLSLDEDGWANVSELLEKSAARDFHFTFDELAEINAERMAAQNHKFYVSENGVWLVDSVPPEFLKAL